MGVFNYGISTLTCVLQKDVLYPKEVLSLQAWIDNSKCKKIVQKYTARFLRRLQVFNINENKPVFFTDQILHEQVFESKCGKFESEQINYEVEIPESLNFDEEEG